MAFASSDAELKESVIKELRDTSYENSEFRLSMLQLDLVEARMTSKIETLENSELRDKARAWGKHIDGVQGLLDEVTTHLDAEVNKTKQYRAELSAVKAGARYRADGNLEVRDVIAAVGRAKIEVGKIDSGGDAKFEELRIEYEKLASDILFHLAHSIAVRVDPEAASTSAPSAVLAVHAEAADSRLVVRTVRSQPY